MSNLAFREEETMAQNRGSTENQGRSTQQQPGMERSGRRSASLATRRDPFDVFGGGPFGLMRRMQEDFDRIFSSFGGGRAVPSGLAGLEADWAPAIEVFQRGNDLVVRAEVPGLSREDLSVEIGDDELTVSGERKQEREDEHEGIYRSERSYGRFCRVIPLPEGALADNAKADFRDGILEIIVPTPPQEVRRGRRIEIGQGRQEKGSDQKA
jgi:HSP20 family protein